MTFKLTLDLVFKNIKQTLMKWGFTKKGLLTNKKGEWYLFSQLLLILLHLLPSWPNNGYLNFQMYTLFLLIGRAISLKGIIISMRAYLDLGESLSPLTYPVKKSNLIKSNSYKKIRHPLYQGLLFISLGICISSLSIIHLLLLISLALILKIKAHKEEERLKIKYTEYENYIREVPAIIKNTKFLDWRS